MIKRALALMILASSTAISAQDVFTKGPVIKQYGENAVVDISMPLPKDQKFKVSFDIATGAEAGKISRQLNTPARFVNMMVRAGVPRDNLQVAVVIHGTATKDMSRKSDNEANKALISALLKAGIKIYVCGQSAAFHKVEKQDLLPGVDMALSAITAHAVLNAQGFKTNPF